MAVSSVQDIQEQFRQPQLVGMGPSMQQPFHPMAQGGNYAPYVPQAPFQMANVQNGGRARGAGGTPVNMGKLSLLSISFSLMLLGAFTFLGGFLLGIWVAAPRAYVPPPQSSYYPTGTVYQPERQQESSFGQNMGRHVGSATESAIKDSDIRNVPIVLSPLVKAAQSEVGRQVGEKVGGYFGQPTSPSSSYQPHPSYPSSAPQDIQLPVVTSQHGTTPISASVPLQGHEDGYAVQLGIYASHENANALMNHVQSFGYPAQIIEGKTPDGSKEYYVRSGLYKDYTTAVNAVSQFSSHNIPGAIIVKTSAQHESAL